MSPASYSRSMPERKKPAVSMAFITIYQYIQTGICLIQAHFMWTDLQCHVVRAGGQQAASGVPLDSVHLILQ